ncbi:MAG: hypothetical protein K6A62_04625 [Bacteroidales bacterium]|nr:hypothetical protein [Bacteroidales bacterium]
MAHLKKFRAEIVTASAICGSVNTARPNLFPVHNKDVHNAARLLKYDAVMGPSGHVSYQRQEAEQIRAYLLRKMDAAPELVPVEDEQKAPAAEATCQIDAEKDRKYADDKKLTLEDPGTIAASLPAGALFRDCMARLSAGSVPQICRNDILDVFDPKELKAALERRGYTVEATRTERL